jgi:hypothetical protein
MSEHHIDEISEIIRRIEAEAYERGKAAAKRELLAFLGQKDATMTTSQDHPKEDSATSESQQQRPVEDRQRAPKGIVPKFVKRVLASSRRGLNPHEILAMAEDDYERMIKLPSVRSELRLGRDKRYWEQGGNWFLIREDGGSEEADGQLLHGEPSASVSNEGGSEDAAALASKPFG